MSAELEREASKLSIKDIGILGLPGKPLQWITEYCDLDTVFNLRLVCKRFNKVIEVGKRLLTTLRVTCAGYLREVLLRVEYCHRIMIEDFQSWLQKENPARDFWLSRLTEVSLIGVDMKPVNDLLPVIEVAEMATKTHQYRMELPVMLLDTIERLGAKVEEFDVSWPMPVTHPMTHELLDRFENSAEVESVNLTLKTKDGNGLRVRDQYGQVNKPLKVSQKVKRLGFMFIRPGDHPFEWIKLDEAPKIEHIDLLDCFPQYTLPLEEVESFAAKCPSLETLLLHDIAVSIKKDQFLDPDSNLTTLCLSKCKFKFGGRQVAFPSITAVCFNDCRGVVVPDHLQLPKLDELVLSDNHGGPANVKPYLNQLRWFSIRAYQWSSLQVLSLPELATSSISESRIDIHNSNCTPLDINTKTFGKLKKIPNLKKLTLMVTNDNLDRVPKVTEQEKSVVKNYFHSLVETYENFEIFKFCYGGMDIRKEGESPDKFVWNEQDIYSIKNNI
jgi:hypothetical protein